MNSKNIIVFFLILCLVLFTGCNSVPPDIIDTTDEPQSGFEVKRFILENDGCKLNAVYTYVNDGKSHPAVLLIAGSGPSDCDETIGVLKPFEDIAIALAQDGINSLRVDKRTFGYASDFDIEYGIEEEYLDDCHAAIEYLTEQNITGLYLLGHSLGGQIATELAANDDRIAGMILFNSSARHLAEIARDQYIELDPANKESYIKHAKAAKDVTDVTAKGYYYYGASDYYWASYNKINVIKNIYEVNKKTLIINSTYDEQSFKEDLNTWSTLFSDSTNVSLLVFDDISHFGYKIDTSNQSSIYTHATFPNEIISAFVDFLKSDN